MRIFVKQRGNLMHIPAEKLTNYGNEWVHQRVWIGRTTCSAARGVLGNVNQGVHSRLQKISSKTDWYTGIFNPGMLFTYASGEYIFSWKNCRPELIFGNIRVHSFLNIAIAPAGRRNANLTKSVALLLITWWHKKLGHPQRYHAFCSIHIIISPHLCGQFAMDLLPDT